MNFENFVYNNSVLPTDPTERSNFFEALKQQWLNELNNNREYQHFFKAYNEDSVELFKLNYVQRKVNLVSNYQYYGETLAKPAEIKFREETEDVFAFIKQKKLFNKQLLWRAGKLNIPEIKCAVDFQFWERNIDSCPFLDEINENEIIALRQFLQSDNYSNELYSWYGSWQDYDTFMQKDEEDNFPYMPEWYEFYDGFLGTGTLLLLPDVIGGMEKKYYDAVREAREKEQSESTHAVQEYKPFLSMSDELFTFAHKFEADAHIKFLFEMEERAHNDYNKTADIREAVDEAVKLLLESGKNIYMQGGLLWNEAIIACAQQYKNEIIASELNNVYEEYLMFRQMNIGNTIENIEEEYMNDDPCRVTRENILKGRKLLGEPENFDYLPY